MVSATLSQAELELLRLTADECTAFFWDFSAPAEAAFVEYWMVAQNPVSHFSGGFGEPLSNRQGNDLSGLYKIKLRSIGIRVIYSLVEIDGVCSL